MWIDPRNTWIDPRYMWIGSKDWIVRVNIGNVSMCVL
jgi:hypothetical protein